MKIKLRNILKVASADIELGGLTVITGENDSGKSTIGKILFSVLKSINNVNQIDKIKTLSVLRIRLSFIKRIFLKYDCYLYLLEDIRTLSIDLIDNNISVEDFIYQIEKEARNRDFPTRTFQILQKHLTQIQQYIVELENPRLAVKREFEMISKSEFMESLNSHGEKNSLIEFVDDTTDIQASEVIIEFNKGDISDIKVQGNSSIEDITYIESPVYLHILNTLRLSSSVPTLPFRGVSNNMQKGDIPYHLADMAEKILISHDELGLFEEYNTLKDGPLLEEINTLIGGDFQVDKKNKQLFFKQNGKKIPTVSVASGIKAFGVLLKLIQNDCVSTSKMLVLDEPEIHLHPEWQIEFCRFIIELVSKGIPIVVSSHSPYFIQGLRYFAAEHGIEKDVTYYMAEKNSDNLAVFEDVTNDLNRVFTLLAAPLNKIMNVDAVRNSRK
jgi:predicted ATP-dependent endonuclease of OLD family